MKTIAILITDISTIGGTERAVINLSNILAEEEYKVYIISIDSFVGKPAYPLNEKVTVITRKFNTQVHKPLQKILNYKKMKKFVSQFVREKSIDYLIGTLCIYNCIITNIKNVKTIGCEHFNYQSAGLIHQLLRKMSYKNLDSVVVLTEKDKENYHFLNNVSVIPNSLSFKPKSSSSLEKKEMISIGRLTCQKGYDILIDTASILRKKLPDWHITIYGDGEDKTSLTDKIEELCLQDYVFIKPPVKDVEAVYKSASIYLSSSRWEGLPMVMIEAQCCGLPIVSFDCNYGPSDIIKDGESGYLIECFDKDVFVEKTIKIATDLSLRKKFGAKAIETSRKFSTETIKEKWLKLLKDLETK